VNKAYTVAFALAILSALLLTIAASGARAQPEAQEKQTDDTPNALCPTLQTVAQANNLPIDFFVRLIWQESRFQRDAIGPVTRNGERAVGIAQFMPGTAAERGLTEPFNPAEALSKSGQFLAELRDQFGNVGLAAAAYNAGPERVRKYLLGDGGIPAETRKYVVMITGRSIEYWTQPPAEEGEGLSKPEPECLDVVAQLRRPPTRPALEMEAHNVPSWCRGLHHPSASMCQTVHLEDAKAKLSHVTLRQRPPPSMASAR
jgi:Transglycosylase SLT domain